MKKARKTLLYIVLAISTLAGGIFFVLFLGAVFPASLNIKSDPSGIPIHFWTNAGGCVGCKTPFNQNYSYLLGKNRIAVSMAGYTPQQKEFWSFPGRKVDHTFVLAEEPKKLLCQEAKIKTKQSLSLFTNESFSTQINSIDPENELKVVGLGEKNKNAIFVEDNKRKYGGWINNDASSIEVLQSWKDFNMDELQIHYHPALKSSDSFKQVLIEAFYFIPRDQDQTPERIYNELDKILKAVKKFHEREFFGISTLEYQIFPSIIIGNKTAEEYLNYNVFYSEIRNRIYSKEGDLYNPEFQENIAGKHVAKMIVVKLPELVANKVDAAGKAFDFENNTFLLVDTPFFNHDPNTTTFHELGHTLGMPDRVERPTYRVKYGEPRFQDDIMRSDVQNIELDQHFLARDMKIAMGLCK